MSLQVEKLEKNMAKLTIEVSAEELEKAIENLDGRVIKKVLEGLEASGEDFRILVLPDHPTPIRVRTHTSSPVPYLLYDSTDVKKNTWHYNEKEAKASGNYVAQGHEMIDYFLNLQFVEIKNVDL